MMEEGKKALAAVQVGLRATGGDSGMSVWISGFCGRSVHRWGPSSCRVKAFRQWCEALGFQMGGDMISVVIG